MSSKTIILIMSVIACLLIGLVVFVYVYLKKQKDRNEEFIEAQKKDRKNYFRFLYNIYQLTPVVRRYLKNLKVRYQSLFPADDITIEIMATKQMTKCLSIFLTIVVAMFFICKGDIPYTLVGITAAYILFTNMMNTSADALERKLLDQLDLFIDDVTSYYHDTKDVTDSIEKTLDDLPFEISLHAQRILQIVTSVDPDYEMENYIEVAPNRFLLLVAAVCSSINECGDKEVDGRSLFLKSLNAIKEELNQERIYLLKKKNAFHGKVVGVLVPLMILKPAEVIMTNSMPDLKNFYRGVGGIVSLALLLLIDIICYELINIHKDTGKETNDTSSSDEKIKKLSEIRFVKAFLTKKVNKDYSKALKETDMLNGIGSKDTWNTYTLKRYIWAIGMFLSVTIVCIFAIGRGKAYVFSDFTNAYGQELVPNEEYRTQMQEISLSLTGKIKKTESISDVVNDYLKNEGYDASMEEAITKELTSRLKSYNNYFYKWWMLVLSICGAVIGYYIPAFLLKKKAQVMSLKRNDEVAQFKTIILILMHMDGIMLDEVLVWMNRFAKVYKSSLSECIMNFEWSQQDSLEQMKEKESGFAPFRRLCDSLMAVDAVGLEKAFDNLETDREFQNKKREEETIALLNSEARKSNTLMMCPIYSVIGFYIVLPFGLFIFNMSTQFTSMF